MLVINAKNVLFTIGIEHIILGQEGLFAETQWHDLGNVTLSS